MQLGGWHRLAKRRRVAVSPDAASLPFDVCGMRKTFGHDARSPRHDAATLFNSLDCKFHFPLNQDSTASRRLRNCGQSPRPDRATRKQASTEGAEADERAATRVPCGTSVVGKNHVNHRRQRHSLLTLFLVNPLNPNYLEVVRHAQF